MTKKRKKPAREPADITTDKTETLAKYAEQPDGSWRRASAGDVPIASRGELPPIALPTDPRGAALVGVDPTFIIICQTCGTWRARNRCEVCGHQEHDT